MKQIIALTAVLSLITFNMGFTSRAYSQNEKIEAEEKIVEKIEAEEVAEELASRSGGTYVKGETVPDHKDTEVALPIIDEETGNILGYVVADKEKLISVLNEQGLTEVANALAAMEAGEAAGETVKAGISGGTIAWVALGIAAIAGIGLALGGGGGGGGGGQTPTTSHQGP